MKNDKIAYSVEELAEILGISRPTAYELVKREDFPAVRISERRIIIPRDALNEYLNRAANGSNKDV